MLKDLTLEVYAGEFLTLLGPSGCGKTTTLRMIAGLERPTTGRIYLEGEDVTHLPPEKRHVNTVFQNYALFPHMNVYQNILWPAHAQAEQAGATGARERGAFAGEAHRL